MPPEPEDAFRRAALLLANQIRENGLKSVLFTSARRGGGTTTSVIATGYWLQKMHDIKPLLIDLTGGKEGLAERLGAESLAGGAAANMPEGVRQGKHGIAVLTLAPQSETDDEMLRPAVALKGALDSAGAGFDVVLVDCPPVLESTVALEAGTVIPRAVVVVEAGTAGEIVQEVRAQLEQNRIQVLGGILNKERSFIPRWIDRWL